MRVVRRGSVVVAVTAALVLAAVAGPVQAGGASWLTATPVSSPIALMAGESRTVTVTNTDRRASSSALTVTLAAKPSSAPFKVANDTCTGTVLAPGASCFVEVTFEGPAPTAADQTAALTVASAKPRKASVTRILEVGVTFDDVCLARGGTPGDGDMITTITLLGATFAMLTVLGVSCRRARLDLEEQLCECLRAPGAAAVNAGPAGPPVGAVPALIRIEGGRPAGGAPGRRADRHLRVVRAG